MVWDWGDMTSLRVCLLQLGMWLATVCEQSGIRPGMPTNSWNCQTPLASWNLLRTERKRGVCVHLFLMNSSHAMHQSKRKHSHKNVKLCGILLDFFRGAVVGRKPIGVPACFLWEVGIAAKSPAPWVEEKRIHLQTILKLVQLLKCREFFALNVCP